MVVQVEKWIILKHTLSFMFSLKSCDLHTHPSAPPWLRLMTDWSSPRHPSFPFYPLVQRLFLSDHILRGQLAHNQPCRLPLVLNTLHSLSGLFPKSYTSVTYYKTMSWINLIDSTFNTCDWLVHAVGPVDVSLRSAPANGFYGPIPSALAICSQSPQPFLSGVEPAGLVTRAWHFTLHKVL